MPYEHNTPPAPDPAEQRARRVREAREHELSCLCLDCEARTAAREEARRDDDHWFNTGGLT